MPTSTAAGNMPPFDPANLELARQELIDSGSSPHEACRHLLIRLLLQGDPHSPPLAFPTSELQVLCEHVEAHKNDDASADEVCDFIRLMLRDYQR